MSSAVSTSSENYFVPLDEDETLPPEFEKLKRIAKEMADGGKVTEHYHMSKTHSVMLTFKQDGNYKRLIVRPHTPEPMNKDFKYDPSSIEDSLAVALVTGRNAANFPSELRRTVTGHPVVVDADFEGTKFAVFYRVLFE
jgi:hypothetical protein